MEKYEGDKPAVIVGFSRCGTTALKSWLGNGASNPEIAYPGTEEYVKNYPNTQPIILTREPVARLWSAYNYHLFFRNWDYDKFLDFRSQQWVQVGLADPIGQCDYEKFIEPFRELGVIVYRLEDLVKIPNYPSDWRGKSTIPIDPIFREKVEKRLKERGITY